MSLIYLSRTENMLAHTEKRPKNELDSERSSEAFARGKTLIVGIK